MVNKRITTDHVLQTIRSVSPFLWKSGVQMRWDHLVSTAPMKCKDFQRGSLHFLQFAEEDSQSLESLVWQVGSWQLTQQNSQSHCLLVAGCNQWHSSNVKNKREEGNHSSRSITLVSHPTPSKGCLVSRWTTECHAVLQQRIKLHCSYSHYIDCIWQVYVKQQRRCVGASIGMRFWFLRLYVHIL